MKINVLSYEPQNGWILFDYASMLNNALLSLGADSELCFEQKAGFDVTFHINYFGLREIRAPGIHCTMVTHIDTAEKFNLVRSQAAAGVFGFCMSDETTRRMNTLSGKNNFFNFAPPAMSRVELRKIRVLVAGRTYPDGRKNESWYIDFFRRFAPDDIVIYVMGSGWDDYLRSLQENGYEIRYKPEFDRPTYTSWLKEVDHLLVAGFDEGALSTLDALLEDVVPIVTAQGYHLEQRGEMILFSTHERLMEIGDELRQKLHARNRILAEMMDWQQFGRKHLDTWTRLLTQQDR